MNLLVFLWAFFFSNESMGVGKWCSQGKYIGISLSWFGMKQSSIGAPMGVRFFRESRQGYDMIYGANDSMVKTHAFDLKLEFRIHRGRWHMFKIRDYALRLEGISWSWAHRAWMPSFSFTVEEFRFAGRGRSTRWNLARVGSFERTANALRCASEHDFGSWTTFHASYTPLSEFQKLCSNVMCNAKKKRKVSAGGSRPVSGVWRRKPPTKGRAPFTLLLECNVCMSWSEEGMSYVSLVFGECDDVRMACGVWCVGMLMHSGDIQTLVGLHFDNQMFYLEEPIRMYACHGNEPNPASSPPTIRLCAVCLASDMPQPRIFSWEKNKNMWKLVNAAVDVSSRLSCCRTSHKRGWLIV